MDIECNRSQYDLFTLECDGGAYKLKCSDGAYWNIQRSSVKADGRPVSIFFIELRAHTHMCIKAPNGEYLKGIPSGEFTADGGSTISPAHATLWEY